MGTTVDELLEQVHSLIDVALDVTADASLADDERHRLVVGLQRERARLGVVAADAISRWDAHGVWCTDGSRSSAHRLARDARMSVASAKREVQRARKLRTMPATRAAVLAGDLSLDHVDLLGRANQPWRDAVFADHEAELVAQCATLHHVDATRLVTYWIHRADARAAEEHAEREYQAAHVHASTTVGGAVVVDGVLDPIGGAVVTKELRRLERELYLADQRSGTIRTAPQRRAAALVEMAMRSASTPKDAKRPRILFSVLLGDDTFRHLCELSTGVVTTPGQVAKVVDAALIETILFDGPTTVVSVSNKRTFTGAVRRAVEVRDRRCTHPSGCDAPMDDCDVDHIEPYARNPVTGQFGGRLQCPPHNRDHAKHDHGAEPLRSRPVDRLDELRATVRWRNRHLFPPEPDDPDDSTPTAA